MKKYIYRAFPVLRRILWSRVAFVLLFSFILPIPNFKENKYFFGISSNSDGNIKTTVELTGKADNLKINFRDNFYFSEGGFIAKLTGSEVLSMPVSICLINNNKIIFDGKPVELADVLDSREGGAMSVKVIRVESLKSDGVELYTRIVDRPKCEVFDLSSGEITVTPAVIRNVLPFGSAELSQDEGQLKIQAKIYGRSEVNFGDSYLSTQVVFDSFIYFRNVLITFLGACLVLSVLRDFLAFIGLDSGKDQS